MELVLVHPDSATIHIPITWCSGALKLPLHLKHLGSPPLPPLCRIIIFWYVVMRLKGWLAGQLRGMTPGRRWRDEVGWGGHTRWVPEDRITPLQGGWAYVHSYVYKTMAKTNLKEIKWPKTTEGENKYGKLPKYKTIMRLSSDSPVSLKLQACGVQHIGPWARTVNAVESRSPPRINLTLHVVAIFVTFVILHRVWSEVVMVMMVVTQFNTEECILQQCHDAS